MRVCLHGSGHRRSLDRSVVERAAAEGALVGYGLGTSTGAVTFTSRRTAPPRRCRRAWPPRWAHAEQLHAEQAPVATVGGQPHPYRACVRVVDLVVVGGGGGGGRVEPGLGGLVVA